MTTKEFVLIGHPVAHSVSPAIHQAAYRSLQLTHRYELADCPTRGDVEHQVQRLRRGEISGANVTVPWKRLALELSDVQHASAQDTGVANVLSLDEQGRVVASNTDAIALAQELDALWHTARSGETPSDSRPPRSALIIGAGGAAQAAVVACRDLNVESIAVCRRSWREELPTEQWDRADVFRQLGAVPVAWIPSQQAVQACRNADFLVQATSAGMEGAGAGEAVSDWIPWAELTAAVVAYDVVYNPPLTPFLRAAEAAGVSFQGGLGMLVRQAAAALKIWLGTTPDLGPLHVAAQKSLSAKDKS